MAVLTSILDGIIQKSSSSLLNILSKLDKKLVVLFSVSSRLPSQGVDALFPLLLFPFFNIFHGYIFQAGRFFLLFFFVTNSNSSSSSSMKFSWCFDFFVLFVCTAFQFLGPWNTWSRSLSSLLSSSSPILESKMNYQQEVPTQTITANLEYSWQEKRCLAEIAWNVKCDNSALGKTCLEKKRF